MKISGKCSWFGGPDDMGVSPSEGLAFIYELDDAPGLFLPEQPPGTTGLARRLDSEKFYIACRWDYSITTKEELLRMRVLVRAPSGKWHIARPADWGPHEDTDRVADLSPGLLEALGLNTDDEVEVFVPVRELPWDGSEKKIVVISSGHGLKIRGASGVIDEVDEARKVVPRVAEYLAEMGCEVFEFHDDVSTNQQENLERICDYHNSQIRQLDVSIHFNAYNGSANGTECLYVSQEELAERVSSLIADASGMVDRGPKYNSGLYFLNNTNEPAILIEVGFCDSEIDAQLYQDNFEDVCRAIAKAIADA